jgi:hypothetical protein
LFVLLCQAFCAFCCCRHALCRRRAAERAVRTREGVGTGGSRQQPARRQQCFP